MDRTQQIKEAHAWLRHDDSMFGFCRCGNTRPITATEHGDHLRSVEDETARDTYAAVTQIKPGKYAGEVRNVLVGQISQCAHGHKSRSIALTCAEKMLSGVDF